jgi:hypothetical protein
MNDERILCRFVVGDMLTTTNSGIYRIKKEKKKRMNQSYHKPFFFKFFSKKQRSIKILLKSKTLFVRTREEKKTKDEAN